MYLKVFVYDTLSSATFALLRESELLHDKHVRFTKTTRSGDLNITGSDGEWKYIFISKRSLKRVEGLRINDFKIDGTIIYHENVSNLMSIVQQLRNCRMCLPKNEYVGGK